MVPLQGVTAREMAQYFFDKDVRLEWESKQSNCVKGLFDGVITATF